MNTLTVTFTALVSGIEFEHEFEFTDSETEQDVKQAIADAWNDEADEDDVRNATANDVEILAFDCSEYEGQETSDYDKMMKEKFDLYTFAEYYCNNDYNNDFDLLEAAFECDIQPSDVDEAYSGKYDDDEDFAYEMALQMGNIKKDVHWPYTCIDWEQAARELMYDYSESNGYYFRNF